MKNVGVIGNEYWSLRLIKDLNGNLYNIKYYNFKNPLDVIKCLLCTDVIVRLGFAPGIKRPTGVIIDIITLIAIKVKKRVILYWTGSDVLRFVDLNNSGGCGIKLFIQNNTEHMAAAPWLVDELAEVNIKAELFYFPTKNIIRNNKLKEPMAMNNSGKNNILRVLSYIPDSAFELYMGKVYYELANKFPMVEFSVFGGVGSWLKGSNLRCLPNLKFLGWVENTDELYQKNDILCRLVKHDAFGGTVREAAVHGLNILYTYKIPGCIYIDKLHALSDSIAVIENLRKQKEGGALAKNYTTIEWIGDELDYECCVNKLSGFIGANV